MPHESPSSNKTLTDNKPHKKLITSKSSQTMTGPQAPGRRHGLLGCFFLLLGVSALGVSAASGAPWTPKTFPNPTVDLEACGRGGIRSWICKLICCISDHLGSFVVRGSCGEPRQ